MRPTDEAIARIKERLRARGLSYRDVEREGGPPASQLSAFLKGRDKGISPTALQRLASILDVPFNWLTATTGPDSGGHIEEFTKSITQSAILSETERTDLIQGIPAACKLPLLNLFRELQSRPRYRAIFVHHIKSHVTLSKARGPRAQTHFDVQRKSDISLRVERGRIHFYPLMYRNIPDGRHLDPRTMDVRIDEETQVSLDVWKSEKVPYAELRLREPAVAGQELRLVFTESYPAGVVAAWEQLSRLIAKQNILDKSLLETSSEPCLYPTGELSHSISFPRGYVPQAPRVLAKLLWLELPEEIGEIERKGFKVSHEDDAVTYSLHVPNPLLGVRYMIAWHPASKQKGVMGEGQEPGVKQRMSRRKTS